MKKKSLIVSSILPLCAIGACAQTTTPASAPEATTAATAAGSEPSPSPFTANINLTTKYKFRGQDQGNTKWFSPALQGGFDWSSHGFYVGAWNSNVSFSNAALEMDFYGGYKGEITKDIAYDVGILQYFYPQRDRILDFNTTEIYGALTYGFFTLKYSHTVSSDYFGIGEAQQAGARGAGVGIGRPNGRNTGYLEGNANFPLVDKLTLNGHVGYTHYASGIRNASYSLADGGGGLTTTHVGVPNFYDYKLGVTYDMSAVMGSGVSAAAAIVGANKRGFYGDINKPRVILTLSKAL
ncbi:MAG: TorF family putative porin [Caldimonas sp.]